MGAFRDFIAVLGARAVWRQPEDLRSRVQSVQFVLSLPRTVRRFLLTRFIREWAVDSASPDGLFLEFGVGEGTSTREIARRMERRGVVDPLYGFDWFKGLPEDWRPGFEQGLFTQARPPSTEKNVRLIVGLFQETLPSFLSNHSEPTSFIHVDCDLYSSTLYILSTLLDRGRIRAGTIILFDELFNYSGWRTSGEFRALTETFPSRNLDFRVIAVAPKEQAVIEVVPVELGSSR